MSELRIELDGARACFRPGETIEGRASWRLDRAPSRVELRLFWYTKGRGDRDVSIAAAAAFDAPADADQRRFQFSAPADPPSFSGKLISLVWALELVVEPGGQVERTELVISPTGYELLLHPVEVAAP